MHSINLWDKLIFKESIVLNDIQSVIKNILDGNVKKIYIRDKFTDQDIPSSILDYDALRYHYELNYTDDKHLCVLNFENLYINKEFVDKYKIDIKKAYLGYLKKCTNDIFVPGFLFDQDIFSVLLDKNLEIILDDVVLTPDEKKMIKEKNLVVYENISGELKRVGFNDCLSIPSLRDKPKTIITVDELLKSNVKYYDLSSPIRIDNYDATFTDLENLLLIKTFLEKLNVQEKECEVEFYALNRTLCFELFKDKVFNNINVTVIVNDYYYTLDEFIEEQKRLEKMVYNIKNSCLSPLERYLAVYTIVKKYKKYKDSLNLEQARVLHYILNNDYIVCLGYVELLAALCEIVGVRCSVFLLNVDTSYKEGYNLSLKCVTKRGHARALVSMDDNKYDVHGIFLSDPTWDNSQKGNYFNHALNTFDKMRISKRLFWFSQSYPVMDVHDFHEYNQIMNYLIDRAVYDRLSKINKTDTINPNELFLESLRDVLNRVINMLRCEIVYPIFKNTLNYCKTRGDYNDLLTKVGQYLLERVNKEVSDEVIVDAAVEAEKVLNHLSIEETNDLKKKLRIQNKEKDMIAFPYKYNKKIPHRLWKKN